MDWQLQLISVYDFVCNEYNKGMSNKMNRFSNYVNLSFSDEEVMTIYMFGIMNNHDTIKSIYNYTNNHLIQWFPSLPSYTAFVQRLNKLSCLFSDLIASLHQYFPKEDKAKDPFVIDSMPIILAQRGRRFKAKVALEIATNNGYCATKKLHYHGVKLHMMGTYQKGSMPVPQYFGITNAGIADIKVYEEIKEHLPKNSKAFADKAYQTNNEPVANQGNVTLFTPVKKAKGQETLDAADKLLSKAISSVRQPIESLFNWIEVKTKIQMASKVRSYEGLMTHLFGKIAVAFFLLKTKFCS